MPPPRRSPGERPLGDRRVRAGAPGLREVRRERAVLHNQYRLRPPGRGLANEGEDQPVGEASAWWATGARWPSGASAKAASRSRTGSPSSPSSRPPSARPSCSSSTSPPRAGATVRRTSGVPDVRAAGVHAAVRARPLHRRRPLRVVDVARPRPGRRPPRGGGEHAAPAAGLAASTRPHPAGRARGPGGHGGHTPSRAGRLTFRSRSSEIHGDAIAKKVPYLQRRALLPFAACTSSSGFWSLAALLFRSARTRTGPSGRARRSGCPRGRSR